MLPTDIADKMVSSAQEIDDTKLLHSAFSIIMQEQNYATKRIEGTNATGSNYVKAVSNVGTAEIQDLADRARRAWG